MAELSSDGDLQGDPKDPRRRPNTAALRLTYRPSNTDEPGLGELIRDHITDQGELGLGVLRLCDLRY